MEGFYKACCGGGGGEGKMEHKMLLQMNKHTAPTETVGFSSSCLSFQVDVQLLFTGCSGRCKGSDKWHRFMAQSGN